MVKRGKNYKKMDENVILLNKRNLDIDLEIDENTIKDKDKFSVDRFIYDLCKKLNNDNSDLRKRIEKRASYGKLFIVINNKWYSLSDTLWYALVKYQNYVISELESRYSGLIFIVNCNNSYRTLLMFICWYSFHRQPILEWIKQLSNASVIGKKIINELFVIICDSLNINCPLRRKIGRARAKKKDHITKTYNNSKKYQAIKLLCFHTPYRDYLSKKLETKFTGLYFNFSTTGLLLNDIKLQINW